MGARSLAAAKDSGSRGAAATPLSDLGCLSEFYHFHLSRLQTFLSRLPVFVCLKDKLSPRSRRLLALPPINNFFGLYIPTQNAPKDRDRKNEKE